MFSVQTTLQEYKKPSNHQSFWICIRGKLGQASNKITVTPLLSKSSVSCRVNFESAYRDYVFTYNRSIQLPQGEGCLGCQRPHNWALKRFVQQVSIRCIVLFPDFGYFVRVIKENNCHIFNSFHSYLFTLYRNLLALHFQTSLK